MGMHSLRRLACIACAWLLVVPAACGYQGERGQETERTQGPEENRRTAEGIRASAAEGVAMGVSTSDVRFVRNLIGFQGPESAKYDPEQDVWFVTNMAGAGSVKDDNGYISRIDASHPDSAVVFVAGGRNGVRLDAPKGTALHGDTLWVADISVLRAFDRHTGAPLANIDFEPLGAVQLNDVAIGPDGQIRVTDTGIMMSPKGVVRLGPDRVFVVGPTQKISLMPGTERVTWPNGIGWDSTGNRWIIASFDPFDGRIFAIPREGKATVVREGSGRLDGLEALPNGSMLFTSWADSSLHLLENGTDRKLLRQLPEAADIGVDTKRRQVAIPLSVLGRVQLWSLGNIGRPARQ
jgi:sugar lactone lactonase YvrE